MWPRTSYTERQKKLVTSSECHSLKSKAQNESYLDTDYVNLSIISASNKQKFTSIKEEINAMKLQEFNFKNHKNACPSGWEFEADKSRYGVYVTHHWNWMNSYWMFWIGCLRGSSLKAHSVSSFCDFRKITFHDLTSFFSILARENLVFFL